jgi:hypothetical protein
MTNPTITVEECLAELRRMFPILTVSVNVYANWIPDRRDKDFVTIRMFGAAPTTPHTREFNAPTLAECMAQVRTWKQEQRG